MTFGGKMSAALAGIALLAGMVACAAAAPGDLAGELARAIDAGHREAGASVQRVAVVDFTGPGRGRNALGQYLAARTEHGLSRRGTFECLADRRHIRTIVDELKLQHSDLFDPQTAVAVGQFAGVEALVVGRITDLGGAVDVDARLVDTRSGAILVSAAARSAKDRETKTLLGRPLTGRVTLRVTPPVDGRVEVAEREVRLEDGNAVIEHVTYGVHRLVVCAEGRQAQGRDVVVDAETVEVTLNLSAQRCRTAFEVMPPDARLLVDGRSVALNGQGYAQVTDLGAGAHSYRAMAEGFRPVIAAFDPCRQPVVVVDLTATDPLYAMKSAFLRKYKEIQQGQGFRIHLATNQERYANGDEIVFSFRTDQDCYLNLVNIGSSGSVTLLFPNAYHRDNFVRAGRTYRIPDEQYGFRFTVDPPLTDEKVYALAGTRPFRVFESDFSTRDFVSLQRGQTRDIAVHAVGQDLAAADLSAAAVVTVRKRRD